jgi:hypothetical protein
LVWAPRGAGALGLKGPRPPRGGCCGSGVAGGAVDKELVGHLAPKTNAQCTAVHAQAAAQVACLSRTQ